VHAHDGIRPRLPYYILRRIHKIGCGRVNDKEATLCFLVARARGEPHPERSTAHITASRRDNILLGGEITTSSSSSPKAINGIIPGKRGHLGLAHTCVTPTRRYATDIARDNARASKCACKEEKRDLLKKKRTTTENSEFFEVFF
jgi:hypothetical protein